MIISGGLNQKKDFCASFILLNLYNTLLTLGWGLSLLTSRDYKWILGLDVWRRALPGGRGRCPPGPHVSAMRPWIQLTFNYNNLRSLKEGTILYVGSACLRHTSKYILLAIILYQPIPLANEYNQDTPTLLQRTLSHAYNKYFPREGLHIWLQDANGQLTYFGNLSGDRIWEISYGTHLTTTPVTQPISVNIAIWETTQILV